MLKKMSFFIGCFILVLPLLSYGFDCNKPDFGAELEDINKDGYFVKYMEKKGISYYNYSGPCSMRMHYFINPSISYAFIDNQFYAQIINISKSEETIEEMIQKIKELGSRIDASTYKLLQQGDFKIYLWHNEQKKLKIKAKIHTKTKMVKVAKYYEPLRAKLPNLKEEDDPVSLMH